MRGFAGPGLWQSSHCQLQVAVHLRAPEVVVQPSLNDIKRTLMRLARLAVESSKAFVRWMDGTCIPCPEQPSVSEDEEPFVHSFYPVRVLIHAWLDILAVNPRTISSKLQ